MMDTTQFDLNNIVALANKIAPAMNYVNGPVMISVVAMSLEDATAFSSAIESRVDKRFYFESFDYRMANRTELTRGRTRALVVMTDHIALGTENVLSFKYSLMTVAVACCSYVGPADFRPIAEDFIVDIEGNPFYKRPTQKRKW